MLEGAQTKLLELVPQSEAQRWLQSHALRISGELAAARWLLAAQDTGFGLFAPRHATVIMVLLVCALSLSAAIFLILEMERPFEGFITVSAEPMRTALAHMGS
jgi:hypothetical protein